MKVMLEVEIVVRGGLVVVRVKMVVEKREV